jgi:hypothetical protein
MRRTKRAVLVGLTAGLFIGGSALSPANAAAGAPFRLWIGTQISGGLPSNLPGDTHCTDHYTDQYPLPYARGCMKEYGDHIYVQDTSPDGHSGMVYYQFKDSQGRWQDAACVNSNGNGTVARCDLAGWIPETDMCIWAGTIEMAQGPHQFEYWIEGSSKVCFTNNN